MLDDAPQEVTTAKKLVGLGETLRLTKQGPDAGRGDGTPLLVQKPMDNNLEALRTTADPKRVLVSTALVPKAKVASHVHADGTADAKEDLTHEAVWLHGGQRLVKMQHDDTVSPGRGNDARTVLATQKPARSGSAQKELFWVWLKHHRETKSPSLLCVLARLVQEVTMADVKAVKGANGDDRIDTWPQTQPIKKQAT